MEPDQEAKLLLNDDCKDIDLFQYLNKKYTITESRQMEFIIEWILSQKEAYKAYKKVYGPAYKQKYKKEMPIGSAKSMASRLLSNVNFDLKDYMSFRGHGLDRMMDSLETLYKTDPKEYLKYTTKLHGLDIVKTEHSGKIEIPTININMYGSDNVTSDE